jgi:NAD-dependent SIR2 family protein deacetylase
MSLSISCESCSNKYEKEIYFDFFKQNDDFVVYKCPKCHTEIQYDELETNKIDIVNWLFENKRDLYFKIVKEYFEPLLESIE